jgi:hypothetical protein
VGNQGAEYPVSREISCFGVFLENAGAWSKQLPVIKAKGYQALVATAKLCQ